MREWLDKLSKRKTGIDDQIEKAEDMISGAEFEMNEEAKRIAIESGEATLAYLNTLRNDSVVLFIFKPIILCSTCLSSLHTLIWYPIFTGSYTWEVIPVMLIVATFNTAIWGAIEKLTK